MIDVTRGISPNKDSNFVAPDGLYSAWETSYAAHALEPSLEWYSGDPARPEQLAALHPRRGVNICVAISTMLGRAFRQIDVEIELRCWLVFLLLGFIVAMALNLDYQWANVPHILDAGNDIFAMFVAVIHRADFGDTKVLT